MMRTQFQALQLNLKTCKNNELISTSVLIEKIQILVYFDLDKNLRDCRIPSATVKSFGNSLVALNASLS